MLIIEICPIEPRADFACDISQWESDIRDCTRPGDCLSACEYLRDQIGVQFRIVARNASGEYEDRIATGFEIEDTARAIYFESDADFSDMSIASTYLIWDAAHSAIEEIEH